MLIFGDFFSLNFIDQIRQKLIDLIKGSPFAPFWTHFGKKTRPCKKIKDLEKNTPKIGLIGLYFDQKPMAKPKTVLVGQSS